MNPRDPNVQLVEGVVRALGALSERFVFVGGCATGLLVTDAARPPVRATQDVDLIVEIGSLAEYYELADELRTVGFQEAGDPMCRWRFGELLVDVMPTDEGILGFSNRWYVPALGEAAWCRLPSGQTIRLISAPLLVATKLEAFYGRGKGDYGTSHDIEDIINVIDGRPELVDEVAKSDAELRTYLREETEGLLGDARFVETVDWHISPDNISDGRREIVLERLRKIAGV
ncbi:MAG TPA: hypothetical protein VGK37_13520 [Casimicrobiaceae bacterium]